MYVKLETILQSHVHAHVPKRRAKRNNPQEIAFFSVEINCRIRSFDRSLGLKKDKYCNVIKRDLFLYKTWNQFQIFRHFDKTVYKFETSGMYFTSRSWRILFFCTSEMNFVPWRHFFSAYYYICYRPHGQDSIFMKRRKRADDAEREIE